MALVASGVLSASAQDRREPTVPISIITLDTIMVSPTKTPENVWDSLSSTSAVRQDTLQQLAPSRGADVLFGIPNVTVQERGDDPGMSINIRGLQDFGRVAVTIDGARQNFQRTGHGADSLIYVEPELLAGVDVIRGPVANVYGSGAIGGVASFRTKEADDILRPGERWGFQTRNEIGSNILQGVTSNFAAFRSGPNDFMVGGTYRDKSNYKSGNGTEIANSGYDVWTGIAKANLRPAEGHTIKLGYIHYDSDYRSGQPSVPGATVTDNGVENDIATARWLYSRPDDRLFNFDISTYWTRTSTDQTKLAGTPPPAGIGNIGDTRNFTINTIGADVNNTSRFDIGDFRHALTYGVDGFQDKVDTTGFGVVFTPSGERVVSGGFLQLKSNYSSWLEVISAVRYDSYKLEGGGVSTDGDRVSPKLTVGLTPIPWITPYATYAEGYRAPALTETLIAGIHPVAFPAFEFLPNPSLKPEIGKNKEAGVNIRFNQIFTASDSFRAKASVFRNDVKDYIDQVGLFNGDVGQDGAVCNAGPIFPPFIPDCIQYQNVARARLEGVEFESVYDAGTWFGGFNFGHVKGTNLTTDQPLSRIAPDTYTTTFGVRLLDRHLTAAVRWQYVEAKTLSDIPLSSGQPAFPPTGSYNLVNLYLGYQINPDVLASLVVENLLDEEYSRYMTYYPGPSNTPPRAFPQPGIAVKGAIQIKFGESFFRKG